MMDPGLQSLLMLFSSLIALRICFCYFYHSKKPISHKISICSVPEVGGAWPIIGHMHLLGGRKLIHKTLSAMADKYGPVFTIRFSPIDQMALPQSC
ncbi:Cytochrome P450 [Melia azedarach]|uniref:Cytochrome P450 n=1 Tax=Melia azedarach TaxID=155640 RepID=A0ACC1XVJ7_MELAZ|nr:Cytochrome P450 [Melia azedarach]